jgi:hypothetical protein
MPNNGAYIGASKVNIELLPGVAPPANRQRVERGSGAAIIEGVRARYYSFLDTASKRSSTVEATRRTNFLNKTNSAGRITKEVT